MNNYFLKGRGGKTWNLSKNARIPLLLHLEIFQIKISKFNLSNFKGGEMQNHKKYFKILEIILPNLNWNYKGINILNYNIFQF